MIDCKIIADHVLCVRRACEWVDGICRFRMGLDARSNKTRNWEEELGRDEDGRDGMTLAWVIPTIILVVLVCLFCWCCCCSKKEEQKRKKDEEAGEDEEKKENGGGAREDGGGGGERAGQGGGQGAAGGVGVGGQGNGGGEGAAGQGSGGVEEAGGQGSGGGQGGGEKEEKEDDTRETERLEDSGAGEIGEAEGKGREEEEEEKASWGKVGGEGSGGQGGWEEMECKGSVGKGYGASGKVLVGLGEIGGEGSGGQEGNGGKGIVGEGNCGKVSGKGDAEVLVGGKGIGGMNVEVGMGAGSRRRVEQQERMMGSGRREQGRSMERGNGNEDIVGERNEARLRERMREMIFLDRSRGIYEAGNGQGEFWEGNATAYGGVTSWGEHVGMDLTTTGARLTTPLRGVSPIVGPPSSDPTPAPRPFIPGSQFPPGPGYSGRATLPRKAKLKFAEHKYPK